jgi:hypothetical protein
MTAVTNNPHPNILNSRDIPTAIMPTIAESPAAGGNVTLLARVSGVTAALAR